MSGLLILLGVALVLLIALLTAMLMREMGRPPRHTAGYALAKGLPCDPGELGLEYEEWRLERPDGAILPVWEVKGGSGLCAAADSRSRASLTALFIHGWGHSRIDALARSGPFVSQFDRLVFYDLRGHGDSRNCLSRLGQDEHNDLLALLGRLGDGKFVLVGHSMGAVIAIAAAAGAAQGDNPIADHIVGIIAYAPYCEFHPSLQGRLRVRGLPARPITDLALLIHKLRGLSPLGLSERTVAQVRCPLLVIHGLEDAVAPISHARRIVAAARDAELHEIAGGAHVDSHEIDPHAHEQIVRRFIERVTDEPRH